MTDYRRRVSFVVVSEQHSADDLRRLIGVEPDVESRSYARLPNPGDVGAPGGWLGRR